MRVIPLSASAFLPEPPARSVHHQRADRVWCELLASGQEAELDEERDFEDFGAEFLDQGGGGGGGAAGGQQIID